MSEEKKPEEERSKLPPDVRVFGSRAYLKEVEEKTFCLFRDIEVERFDRKARKPVREKVRELQLPGAFRECETDEERKQPDLQTVHPSTGRVLLLKRIEGT